MTIARSDIGENIEFETSSGNVFADIGFENAQEMLFKSELVRLWGSLWNIQGKYPLECAIGAGVPKGIAIGVGSGGVVRASVLVRVAFAEHPPRLKGSQLAKFVPERLLALFVINHKRFGD